MTSKLPLFLLFITVYNASIQANDNVAYYLKYSKATDPGRYAYLYKELPDSIAELCHIINHQFIHPAKVDQYPELKDKGRYDEKYQNIEDVLGELVNRNAQGLTINRKPEERLILACGHFAKLLASIMKYKQVPARVRVGFAAYLPCPLPDKHIDHWICEIWDKNNKRWIYVDPDVQKVDFPRIEFESASQVWFKLRTNKINPESYGLFKWWGADYIKGNLCHDFFACLNDEQIYWKGPNIFHEDYYALSETDLELLSTLADYLHCPEKHIEALLKLRKDRIEFSNIK